MFFPSESLLKCSFINKSFFHTLLECNHRNATNATNRKIIQNSANSRYDISCWTTFIHWYVKEIFLQEFAMWSRAGGIRQAELKLDGTSWLERKQMIYLIVKYCQIFSVATLLIPSPCFSVKMFPRKMSYAFISSGGRTGWIRSLRSFGDWKNYKTSDSFLHGCKCLSLPRSGKLMKSSWNTHMHQAVFCSVRCQ